MERRIGEIFECKGEWYQCVESDSCRCGYCDFDRLGDCDTIACKSDERKDGKEVYFNKLEKVGEMYEKRVSDVMFSTFQRYKVCSPVILPKEPYIYYNFIDSTIEIEIKQTKEDMEEYRMYDAKEDIPEFDKVVDECLFGEDKLNLKPFDLEAAKAGKTVCTRDGRKARIICFDKKNDYYPIIALVETEGKECIFQYTSNGEYLEGNENNSHSNLMMLPEKRVGWINVKKDASLFKSREEAERNCTKDYASVRVEFEI